MEGAAGAENVGVLRVSRRKTVILENNRGFPTQLSVPPLISGKSGSKGGTVSWYCTDCTYAQLGSLVVAAVQYDLRQVDVLLVPTNVHVSALLPRRPHLTMILLNCASKEVQVNYGCHHRLGTELTFQKVVRQTTEIRRCGITSAIQSATRDPNPRNLSRLVQSNYGEMLL